MSPLHRLVTTLAALLVAATVTVGLAPAASAASTGASPPCSTVRQYVGWCRDARGSAWMNFTSVYVWDQYHVRGFAYRSLSGVAVRGEPEARGFTTGATRQQLSYSTPVRTTSLCTQGWGKLSRAGSESAQGLTTLVCCAP